MYDYFRSILYNSSSVFPYLLVSKGLSGCHKLSCIAPLNVLSRQTTCFCSATHLIKIKMVDPVRVVITGAAGQIGYSLVYMVASGSVFGPNQPMILQLLDIPPAMGILGGLLMELDDCAFPLVKKVVATADPMEAFKVIVQLEQLRLS